jgi:hypothetical protein
MLEPPSAWQSLEPSAAVWLIELQERFALVTASRSAILMHIAKQQERNPMTMRPDPTFLVDATELTIAKLGPMGRLKR